MTTGADIAEVAALAGEPARANMLALMLDGRAYAAGELARAAGVTPATASEHLAKLVEGRLAAVARQGRSRYFRLASPAVARALEGLMALAAERPAPRRATPRIAPELREARTCYDHLAGRLAVALADRLAATGAIVMDGEAAELTEAGHAQLAGLGVVLPPKRARRIACRPCLDWSERRPHVAGAVGAALLEHGLRAGWWARGAGRVVHVTAEGCEALSRAFGPGLFG